MANFDTAAATLQSVSQATGLLGGIRALYSQAKQMQTLLALYSAGTDAKFTTAVNTIYIAAERAELSAMLTQVNALVTDWETNHRLPLGLP
jgi:hypothetical protein